LRQLIASPEANWIFPLCAGFDVGDCSAVGKIHWSLEPCFRQSSAVLAVLRKQIWSSAASRMKPDSAGFVVRDVSLPNEGAPVNVGLPLNDQLPLIAGAPVNVPM